MTLITWSLLARKRPMIQFGITSATFDELYDISYIFIKSILKFILDQRRQKLVYLLSHITNG